LVIILLSEKEGLLEKNVKLGELLINSNVIDGFQLNAALSYKRHWGGRMGESLIRLGYISEKELCTFLTKQFDLPQVDLITQRISPEVLSYIPESKAREFCVIPVDRLESRGIMHLVVAMPDPTNLYVIDTLQFLTDCWIQPTMASADEILKAVNLQYGVAAGRRVGADHTAPLTPFPPPSGFETSDQEEIPLSLTIRRLEDSFEKLMRLLIKRNSPLIKDLDDLLNSFIQGVAQSGKS
jgi:type IV pilus assembly protein PilB